MKRTSSGAYESVTFIVRLWREADGSVDADWRGTAVHVQTGAERGIHGLDELMGFIHSWTNAPDSDAAAQG
jgi:hypothetical protein